MVILSKEEQAVVELFAYRDRRGLAGDLAAALRTLIATAETVFALPEEAVLLWSDCTRQSTEYTYPAGLVAKWKDRCRARLDRRMHNGPPNSAFKIAGGDKPKGWELDHIL